VSSETPPENEVTEETADNGSAGASEESHDPLAEAEAKLAQVKEQLLRTAADFDNYRKRSRREIEDAGAAGRENMLKDLLPVFDNLERATAQADTVTDVASFANGIQMVVRQFADTLKRGGIERVASMGAPFDPMVHEAIQQLETDEVEPGCIAAEVQAGYRLGDRLIRPAMVVVAKPKSQAANAAPEAIDDADGMNDTTH
jgi:molecular chaperone GrpE